MRKLLLFGGCVLVLLVSAVAQDREKWAAAVLGAGPSHPVRVAAGGVRLELRGIYVCESLLWLSFRAENRSAIDFRADPVRFSIRDRRAFKRRARQEIPLWPVYRKGPGMLQSDSTVSFCDALVPRVPGKEQELVVEWVERNGDRRVRLRVKVGRLLKARKVR